MFSTSGCVLLAGAHSLNHHVHAVWVVLWDNDDTYGATVLMKMRLIASLQFSVGTSSILVCFSTEIYRTYQTHS